MAVRSHAQTMTNASWKILIIDDDEDDYLIARDLLKEAKGRRFDIHWVNTYAAGKEELNSRHYNAVLVDYDLGKHSGIELIREINERGYAAPLILFTGRGNYEVDIEAMEAGATLYLTKGEVNPLLMERAIRYAIEIKQRENELREARETAERELAERRRAEAELLKSEAALRRIDARWNAAIDSFDIGAIIATEDEQVIYWNPAAREMHGFTRPDEGIGPLEETPVTFQLWTPDGSHLLELDEWPMRRIKRGETVRNLELCIRRPDQGWEKFFSYSGVMVDTAAGERLIFLTCQDLTEKHRIEDALRENEERLRIALDTANMVAWEYDPATLKVTFSDNAEQVLELPRRHETSNQGYGMIHPEDVEKHRALVSEAIATGGSYVSVYRHPHTEKVIWLEEHGRARVDREGKTVRLVGVVQNVTRRKEAEAALRQSEEKYAKSFRSSPAAIAISTVAEGRFTEVNERFTEIFGYSREEMIGRTSVELGFYSNLEERNKMLRLLRQEGRFRDYEISMRNRSGEPRDLLLSGEQIEIEGQDYLLALIMDNTDRKQAERTLAETAEKLARSNRELEEFAFVASHDLQEPVRKIIMFGGSLRSHLRDTGDETVDDYLSRMQSAAERMQEMIAGLLELSRVNAKGGNFKPIDLNRIIGDVLSDLEGRIQAASGRVQIGNLPTVEADEIQMRQLFLNLIGNAIKFQSPGVSPVVQITAAVDSTRSPQFVEIQVDDNGIGFEQEYADRIFQPFQRLNGRSAYEGTGLGLAICKKIIERHHGSIEVKSAPGEGASFTIRIPAKPISPA